MRALLSAGDGDRVVPVERIEADLFGRLAVEDPVEVRRPERAVRAQDADGHVHVAVLEPLRLHALGLIRHVDVHSLRQVLVVLYRRVGQRVTPRLEGGREAGAVDRVPLGRHPPSRRVDRRVGQLRLELLRGRHEVLAREAHEQTPVLLGAVEGETSDLPVRRAEVLEARVRSPCAAHDEPVVA